MKVMQVLFPATVLAFASSCVILGIVWYCDASIIKAQQKIIDSQGKTIEYQKLSIDSQSKIIDQLKNTLKANEERAQK